MAGELADLGLVGEPDGTDASLLADLLALGCIPVVASIGVDADGVLLNVNADVLAAHLAAIAAGEAAHRRRRHGRRARRRRPDGAPSFRWTPSTR